MVLTSVGGANDFVASSGLVDYQLFNIARQAPVSISLIAQQDYRYPDIGLPIVYENCRSKMVIDYYSPYRLVGRHRVERFQS